MKEKNLGVEREWCNEMKNGQKLKLGDATTVSPQELSKKYKRQSLGMPKASPSSSIKILGFFQTLHFYCFMHSCVVLGASYFFLFWFFICLVCFVCLVCLNKLVGPPHSYISFQISWFGVGRE